MAPKHLDGHDHTQNPRDTSGDGHSQKPSKCDQKSCPDDYERNQADAATHPSALGYCSSGSFAHIATPV